MLLPNATPSRHAEFAAAHAQLGVLHGVATTTLALVTSTIETLEEQARTIAVLHLGANQAEALRGAEEAATAHPVALAMATRQLALRTVTGATPSAPLHERRITDSSPIC